MKKFSLEERIIVALDLPSWEENRALIKKLPQAKWFKVGLPLFIQEGKNPLFFLRDQGKKIFLDLKLYDIPSTLERAGKVLSSFPVDYISTSSPSSSVASLKRSLSSSVALLGVTYLTSEEISSQEVLSRSYALGKAGVDGLILSAGDAPLIREKMGEELLLISPGIRLVGDHWGDQKRVFSPKEAFLRGVDQIVIGRSLYTKRDPRKVFLSLLEEISPLF